MTTRAVATLTTCVTCVGVVGSVYDLDDKLAGDFPVLAPYVEQIEFAFIAAVLLASGALAVLLSMKVREVWQQRDFPEKGPFRRRLQHYSCQDVRGDDLAILMKIYSESINGQTSLVTSQRLYAKCRKGWKKIVDNRSNEIVGYFVLLPLSKKGEQAILSREFDFGHPDIVSFFIGSLKGGFPVYLGMIGALDNSKDVKAFAIDRLSHFANAKKYSRYYARAATEDGLRLVKKKSFTTVFPEDRFELGVMFVKHVE